MAFQFGEVVERIDPVELARVDQAHVEISDASTILGPIKVAVLSMEDNLFQRTFRHVVVQWGSRFSQEERQLFPVVEHVRDGFAEARIGLHQSLIELALEPFVKFVHDRAAVGLVEEQPRLG